MHFQLTVFYVNNVNTTGRGKRQENPLKRANFAGNSWVKLVPRPPPTSLLEHSQFLGISDPLIATAFLTPMIFLDPLHLLTLQNKTFFLTKIMVSPEIHFWNLFLELVLLFLPSRPALDSRADRNSMAACTITPWWTCCYSVLFSLKCLHNLFDLLSSYFLPDDYCSR